MIRIAYRSYIWSNWMPLRSIFFQQLNTDLMRVLMVYLYPFSSSICFTFSYRHSLSWSALSALAFISAAISLYLSGLVYFITNSSSSVLMAYNPRRCARGIYRYWVSDEMVNFLVSFIESSVRILCSRSHIFKKIT